MELPSCPCCVAPYLVFQMFIVFLVLYYTTSSLLIGKKSSRLWKGLMFSLNAILLVLFFIAIAVTQSSEFRAWFFSRLFFYISNIDKPDPTRCGLFSGLSGRVLELGPGPGTNFKCFVNNTAITDWVGVEPNNFFREKQQEMISKKNLNFNTKSVWMKGEDLDVESSSFDYVIGTHVLCSVGSVADVLYQIDRALKPTGSYIFYEHVLSADNDDIRWWQELFAPLFYYLGNGCNFRQLDKEISNHFASIERFEVNYTHFEAEVPIPIIKPHISGTVLKL